MKLYEAPFHTKYEKSRKSPAYSAFQPEGEKHFLSPDVIKDFAEILVLTFLSSFQQEATKAAKSAGKSAFKWMRDSIADLFAKKKVGPIRKKAERRVVAGAKKAAALSADRFESAVTKAREALQLELEATLPSNQALAFSKKIMEQSVKRVLKKPASKETVQKKRPR